MYIYYYIYSAVSRCVTEIILAMRRSQKACTKSGKNL